MIGAVAQTSNHLVEYMETDDGKPPVPSLKYKPPVPYLTYNPPVPSLTYKQPIVLNPIQSETSNQLLEYMETDDGIPPVPSLTYKPTVPSLTYKPPAPSLIHNHNTQLQSNLPTAERALERDHELARDTRPSYNRPIGIEKLYIFAHYVKHQQNLMIIIN